MQPADSDQQLNPSGYGSKVSEQIWPQTTLFGNRGDVELAIAQFNYYTDSIVWQSHHGLSGVQDISTVRGQYQGPIE